MNRWRAVNHILLVSAIIVLIALVADSCYRLGFYYGYWARPMVFDTKEPKEPATIEVPYRLEQTLSDKETAK